MAIKVKSTGRPTVITQATVQKLEHAFHEGFTVERACQLSGVGRSTFYAHLQSDPDFVDKITLAQSWATERAKQVVIQAIDQGNLKIAVWWLERKLRQEFSPNPPSIKEEAEDDFVGKYFGGDNDKFLDFMEQNVKALKEASAKEKAAQTT
ncbi:MAG TPA: hypothetical protein VFN56_00680 [Candidatus Saccharimonadales bacterium]|nr:hypothetical protein [Candidatus Saccharimonadales bacterium]